MRWRGSHENKQSWKWGSSDFPAPRESSVFSSHSGLAPFYRALRTSSTWHSATCLLPPALPNSSSVLSTTIYRAHTFVCPLNTSLCPAPTQSGPLAYNFQKKSYGRGSLQLQFSSEPAPGLATILATMDDDSISDLSSDLSSLPSLSPPPMDYPSPVSSQDYDSNVAASQQSQSRECDGPPPAKKRKTMEPKPRTTQHLDLSPFSTYPAIGQEAQLDLLMKVLRKRRKIVVIAGAGISVSAGSKHRILQIPYVYSYILST